MAVALGLQLTPSASDRQLDEREAHPPRQRCVPVNNESTELRPPLQVVTMPRPGHAPPYLLRVMRIASALLLAVLATACSEKTDRPSHLNDSAGAGTAAADPSVRVHQVNGRPQTAPASQETSTEPAQHRISAFWAWFLANAKDLNDERRFRLMSEELSAQLRSVHPELVYEIEGRGEWRRFAVSADGNRSIFPVVVELVKNAPTIPNWEIVAFRQASSTDLSIKIGELSLEPSDLAFELHSESNQLSLSFYMRGYDRSAKDSFEQAASILISNAVGEYLFATALSEVELRPLPSSPMPEKLRPIQELAQALDRAMASQKAGQ